MAKEIELPDGSIAEFPDDMHDDAIAGVLAKQFPAKPKAQPASVFKRALTGLADPIIGIAQVADKAINPIRQMVRPGATSMDDYVKQREAEYQAPEGIDFARIAGNVANPINYIGGGGPALWRRAAMAGAAQGAMAPTVSDDYWTEKAKQAGAGALVGTSGHVLGRALGYVREGAKPTEDAMQYQLKMTQGNRHTGQPPPPMLTPGQLADPEGWLRKAEDMVSHTPFVGAPLRERQGNALRGYRDWSRDIATPPGAPGTSGKTIESLKAAFSDSYNGLLDGKNIVVQSSTSV